MIEFNNLLTIWFLRKPKQMSPEDIRREQARREKENERFDRLYPTFRYGKHHDKKN